MCLEGAGGEAKSEIGDKKVCWSFSKHKNERTFSSSSLHAAAASRAARAASCTASRATAATPSTLEGCPVESLLHRGVEEGEDEGTGEDEEEGSDGPPPPPLLLSREISKAPTARTFLKTTGIEVLAGGFGAAEEGEEEGRG